MDIDDALECQHDPPCLKCGPCVARREVNRLRRMQPTDAEGHPITQAVANRMVATIAAQADEIDEWKGATGLERGGDPDGVRPCDLEAEVARLRAASPVLLIEAAEDFIAKCDSGRARSSDSYAKFKAALAGLETAK